MTPVPGPKGRVEGPRLDPRHCLPFNLSTHSGGCQSWGWARKRLCV